MALTSWTVAHSVLLIIRDLTLFPFNLWVAALNNSPGYIAKYRAMVAVSGLWLLALWATRR